MARWRSGLTLEGEAFVLHGGRVDAAVTMGLSFLALLGLVPIAVDPAGVGLVGVPYVVVFGVLSLRYGRVEVRGDPNRLLLRTPFRTYALPWAAVAAAEVARVNTATRLAIVKVRTTDGRAIRVGGASTIWRGEDNRGSDVGRAVALINSRARVHA